MSVRSCVKTSMKTLNKISSRIILIKKITFRKIKAPHVLSGVAEKLIPNIQGFEDILFSLWQRVIRIK